jgi:hypothetical protein
VSCPSVIILNQLLTAIKVLSPSRFCDVLYFFSDDSIMREGKNMCKNDFCERSYVKYRQVHFLANFHCSKKVWLETSTSLFPSPYVAELSHELAIVLAYHQGLYFWCISGLLIEHMTTITVLCLCCGRA